MIRSIIFTSFILFSVTMFAQKELSEGTTTYYFIRHAEKDVSDPLEKNPHLTDIGHKRAESWSNILENIKFDAVYATHYIRTQETAKPTADKNKLEITIYPVRSKYDETFKTATFGKTVLIVGHNNTIPEFVNDVIGKQKYGEIEDSNNGNLYIVTITNGFINDMLLKIN